MEYYRRKKQYCVIHVPQARPDPGLASGSFSVRSRQMFSYLSGWKYSSLFCEVWKFGIGHCMRKLVAHFLWYRNFTRVIGFGRRRDAPNHRRLGHTVVWVGHHGQWLCILQDKFWRVRARHDTLLAGSWTTLAGQSRPLESRRHWGPTKTVSRA